MVLSSSCSSSQRLHDAPHIVTLYLCCAFSPRSPVKLRDFESAVNNFEKALERAKLVHNNEAQQAIISALDDANKGIIGELRKTNYMENLKEKSDGGREGGKEKQKMAEQPYPTGEGPRGAGLLSTVADPRSCFLQARHSSKGLVCMDSSYPYPLRNTMKEVLLA
ncbi:hypothetical protein H8959_019608 [Pygathrix nigripes]